MTHVVCDNRCRWAFDSECDYGGEGSEYEICEPGTDCADCNSRGIHRSQDLPTSAICREDCPHMSWSSDGECDDGGHGAEYASRPLGHDCADCGVRTTPPVACTARHERCAFAAVVTAKVCLGLIRIRGHHASEATTCLTSEATTCLTTAPSCHRHLAAEDEKLSSEAATSQPASKATSSDLPRQRTWPIYYQTEPLCQPIDPNAERRRFELLGFVLAFTALLVVVGTALVLVFSTALVSCAPAKATPEGGAPRRNNTVDSGSSDSNEPGTAAAAPERSLSPISAGTQCSQEDERRGESGSPASSGDPALLDAVPLSDSEIWASLPQAVVTSLAVSSATSSVAPSSPEMSESDDPDASARTRHVAHPKRTCTTLRKGLPSSPSSSEASKYESEPEPSWLLEAGRRCEQESRTLSCATTGANTAAPAAAASI